MLDRLTCAAVARRGGADLPRGRAQPQRARRASTAATYGVGRLVERAVRVPRALRLPARRAPDGPTAMLPARGERFHVALTCIEPKTRAQRPARLARDLAHRSSRSSIAPRDGATSMLGNDVIDLGDPETLAGRLPRALRRARLRSGRARRARARARCRAPALDRCGRRRRAAYKVAAKVDRRDGVLAAALRGAPLTERRPRPTSPTAPRSYTVALEVERALRARDRWRDVGPGAPARWSRASSGSPPAARPAPGPRCARFAIAHGSPAHLGIAAVGAQRRARRAHPTPRAAPATRVGADLSLSHHGRFVAFACVLPATSDELRGAL